MSGRTPIDVDRMRKAFLEPPQIGTHYADCQYTHWRCALARCLDEIETLRNECKDKR